MIDDIGSEERESQKIFQMTEYSNYNCLNEKMEVGSWMEEVFFLNSFWGQRMHFPIQLPPRLPLKMEKGWCIEVYFLNSFSIEDKECIPHFKCQLDFPPTYCHPHLGIFNYSNSWLRGQKHVPITAKLSSCWHLVIFNYYKSILNFSYIYILIKILSIFTKLTFKTHKHFNNNFSILSNKEI